MEMHQLRYFAKVAELGNFTRAAEQCHVSQPSLSQQIAKLEEELGQPLFERLGRSVRLTEAGRLLQERAIQILRLVDEARAEVADDPEAGRLVVAAIPTVAPYLLPDLLSRFAQLCPRARVEIREEPTADILRYCHQGEIDLAVLALPVSGENLHIEPLLTEELFAVLPAGHPLAESTSLRLQELAEQSFIVLGEAHCLTATTLHFCHQHARTPMVTARMHQLTTLLELVRLGHGVSLVPEMAAKLDRDPGRVYRAVRPEKLTRTIALCWSQLRYQTRLFHRFVSLIRETVSL